MPGSRQEVLRNKYMNQPPDGALVRGGRFVDLIVDGVFFSIGPRRGGSSNEHHTLHYWIPSWSYEEQDSDRWGEYDTFYRNVNFYYADVVVSFSHDNDRAQAVSAQRSGSTGGRNVFAWNGTEWTALIDPVRQPPFVWSMRPTGLLPGTDVGYASVTGGSISLVEPGSEDWTRVPLVARRTEDRAFYAFTYENVDYAYSSYTGAVSREDDLRAPGPAGAVWGLNRLDTIEFWTGLISQRVSASTLAGPNRRRLANNLHALYTRGSNDPEQWRKQATRKQIMDAVRTVANIGTTKNRSLFISLMGGGLSIVEGSTVCSGCGRGSTVEGTANALGLGACEAHVYECMVCGDHVAHFDAVASHERPDDFSCPECAGHCDYHDVRYADATCHRCTRDPRPNRYSRGGHDGTVRGYGHTTPTKWLDYNGEKFTLSSNPDAPYYLGIELEIGTRVHSARTLLQWAHKTVTRRFLDPKADSSVDGYEIATGAMTPHAFEAVDWDGFFEVLNSTHERPNEEAADGERSTHGLHVHISRTAFQGSDLQLAAFARLIAADQSKHLERIARRAPYRYCNRVASPVKTVLADHWRKNGAVYDPYGNLNRDRGKKSAYLKQAERVYNQGVTIGRDAINLGNSATVEIRAFKSTRRPEDLRNAVRFVYLTAEYVRFLAGKKLLANRKALTHEAFLVWVNEFFPEAHDGLAGTVEDQAPDQEQFTAEAIEPQEVSETSARLRSAWDRLIDYTNSYPF